jgi:hypothetical protein
MNRNMMLILLVVAGLLIAAFSGVLPLEIYNLNTTTDNKEYGGLRGVGEMIGPNGRKGFITSYMENGLSETVTLQSTVALDTWAWAIANAYHYEVYGKKDQWGSWEKLSVPGSTSQYISTPNPGVISFTGFQVEVGGSKDLQVYSFEFVGNVYKAIRTELYVNCKNGLNPLDPFTPRLIQRDEAYLYEGWGGLYLPTGTDGRPRSTFEIGETVNIDVQTTYGGYTVGENAKTWRVALIEPADVGGNEIKHQDYGDNVRSHFTFTVTADMFKTNSNNRYRIEIYNTLLPQGTLNVNTIDILAKAPSDVTFSGVPTKVSINTPVAVTVSANVNAQTQLPISFFEISVIYGGNNVLLPTSPTDPKWIIPTTDIQASGNQATFTITPTMQSYVTIHAKAYDTEGRASQHTRYSTFYAYTGTAPPDDTIPDVGEGDYGGGHFAPWWPWEPFGEWEIDYQMTFMLIAVIIFLIGAMAAALLPLPYQVKIFIVILGALAAVVFYYIMNGGFY